MDGGELPSGPRTPVARRKPPTRRPNVSRNGPCGRLSFRPMRVRRMTSDDRSAEAAPAQGRREHSHEPAKAGMAESERKVVVITGASGGIGAAVARLLGAEGHALVL